MIANLVLAASRTSGELGGPEIIVVVLVIGLLIFMIAAQWKLFEKAGQPGWAAIVPIYNLYIMCKMIDKSGWWVLMMCLPYIGIIFSIIFEVSWCGRISKDFGRGTGTAIGLFFLPFIFVPILAFGSAKYGDGSWTPHPYT
jgi:hypothetical protein